jgi:hypothetical protein
LLIHRGIHWTSYAVPWVQIASSKFKSCVILETPISLD